MNKCRLYIADMDDGFVARIRRLIASSPGIEIAGNTGNGKAALKEIIRLSPDVVLSDIPLPDLDGIALLRETQRLRCPPAVIICTRFYSEASMQCACQYGAAFFLCKPIELLTLPDLIIACSRSRQTVEPGITRRVNDNEAQRGRANAARAFLKGIGMPSKLDGSAYFIEAAVHCHDNELLLRNLSRGLYVQLAKRMDSTVSRIERSMRNAIDIAYQRGNLRAHFTRKPTNREFLEYMLHTVKQAGTAQHQ